MVFTVIYQQLNLKSHQTLYVRETFIRTNPTLSFRKSLQYELHIRCTLRPRAQDAGSVLLKIPTLTFFPGSTFHPNHNAVATGLSFVNVLITQSESKLPILTENSKNHQNTSLKGRIGFSSSDVSDNDEPKYQIRDPYELTNAIL